MYVNKPDRLECGETKPLTLSPSTPPGTQVPDVSVEEDSGTRGAFPGPNGQRDWNDGQRQDTDVYGINHQGGGCWPRDGGVLPTSGGRIGSSTGRGPTGVTGDGTEMTSLRPNTPEKRFSFLDNLTFILFTGKRVDGCVVSLLELKDTDMSRPIFDGSRSGYVLSRLYDTLHHPTLRSHDRTTSPDPR